MRAYGKIEVGFWQRPKVKALSERARVLFLYVLACPHGNSVGCFVLPVGYASADLGWTDETVRELVSELVAKQFLERDEATSLTRVRGWWGHNTIENANVAKAALKTMRHLPRCVVFHNAVRSLEELRNRFINPLRNEFADVFATPEPNLTEPNQSEPSLTKPEPNRPVRNVENKKDDSPERASRASKPKSADTKDPAVRQQVWEQRVIAYITAHWPAERAQQAITAYLEGTQHGRDEFEAASAEMRAVRTDGSIPQESRTTKDELLGDSLDGMAMLRAAMATTGAGHV